MNSRMRRPTTLCIDCVSSPDSSQLASTSHSASRTFTSASHVTQLQLITLLCKALSHRSKIERKMASLPNPTPPLALLFLLVLLLTQFELNSADEGLKLAVADALEWSTGIMYNEFGDGGLEQEAEEDEEWSEGERRSLFWRAARYYISYGALSANRVPCPPRSGRSYYTHNCYRARGPIRPYVRGCSAICRCRR